jgi:hypothetical protein
VSNCTNQPTPEIIMFKAIRSWLAPFSPPADPRHELITAIMEDVYDVLDVLPYPTLVNIAECQVFFELAPLVDLDEEADLELIRIRTRAAAARGLYWRDLM